jgi:hypothetical protein
MSTFKDYAKDFGIKNAGSIVWFAVGVAVGICLF